MTSTTETKQALERAAEPQPTRDIRGLIERMEPDLVRSLETPAAAQALMRHYLTAIRHTPGLLACTDESILAALLFSAQLRLEPGPLGHVYLWPAGNECVWNLGYTGIIELTRRSGSVAGLSARVVWDNDLYEKPWVNQTGVHYEHRYGEEKDRKERVGVLVTWRELSGGKWFARAEAVEPSRIERARKASRAKSGPWFTDPDPMWQKTGIREVRKWLPLSPQAGQALAYDGATMHGLTDEAELIADVEE